MVEPAGNAEIAALRAALAAAEQRADLAEAEAARVVAEKTDGDTEIARLKLEIEKLKRSLYGQRSERKAKLLDQLEFELEDLEAAATEDEFAAEMAAAKAAPVRAFTRKRAQRRAFPDHLPRERVVVPAPQACECCGSDHLVKLGEDVTETLEVIPRQWKVVQTVREKFSCRDCEKISQPPAPFHPTPRGFAGPNLLATILFEKFGQHQPLNRQSERFAREGVPVSLSTLADQVGAATVALKPLHDLIADHVMAADRLHGDDTTVPILAKGQTRTGRVWTYVRDDRPVGGTDGPAALFYASPDRRGEHPRSHLVDYSGILQVDAFAGYNGLFDPERRSEPIQPAFCWAHGRRPLFGLADIERVRKKKGKGGAISPVALEAVRRIDEIFAIERDLHSLPPDQRLAERQRLCAPLVDELHTYMITEREKLSRHAPVAKAMNYMLARWVGFAAFLEDGRICLSNNAAERALRGIALGRKAWLFAGSDRGARRAAFMYTLIVSAKLNDIDPQAWLADVLARIADMPQNRLGELLPWNWNANKDAVKLVA
jgi:transposase